MNELLMPPIYRKLLIAVHDFFDATDQANGQLQENQIGNLRNHGINPGIARAGLQWLSDQSFLVKNEDSDQHSTWFFWEFTPKGAELVHDIISLLDDHEVSSVKTFDIAPNNFLDLRPLKNSVDELSKALIQISYYIETNNELTLPSVERATVVIELRSLQTAVESGSVRSATLASYIAPSGILQFLKDKIPDKTIAALVTFAVNKIAHWLGL